MASEYGESLIAETRNLRKILGKILKFFSSRRHCGDQSQFLALLGRAIQPSRVVSMGLLHVLQLELNEIRQD